MQGEERNQSRKSDKNEEWETGYPGYMSIMWYQDVQDRQGIALYDIADSWGRDIPHEVSRPIIFANRLNNTDRHWMVHYAQN
jgi:hypothetical protein